MTLLLAFVLSLGLSLGLTPYIAKLAIRFGLVDDPAEASRKIHKVVTPRAGGVVIWLSFFIVSLVFLPSVPRSFWGLMLAATLVFLLGLWDDARRLSAWFKLGVQVIAATVAILGFGLSVDVISNPFGQNFSLVGPQLTLFGASLAIVPFCLTLLWLVGMTNTINFLDGLDGLAGGVSAIAAFILFLVSLLPRINQPSIALLGIILCGACLGFLRYNFAPAKIFLGDSGAYFLGMILGGLSIVSGAKLATALLVLGVPVLDALWAVTRRLLAHKSPFTADRGHVHHLLLDLGLSQRQVALVIYSFALAFGLVATIAGSAQKLFALIVLTALVVCGIFILTLRRGRKAVLNNASK
jgi:UDP-GlcNAc:undecaprenyl-phosphate GlcNAc-1-phosphate transferase